MITSHLQSSNSPTQEKSYKPKCKSIESVIIDNDDKQFPVEITYDYSDYYGWNKWEVSVWGHDHKLNGEASISPRDLDELIKDIIREEEGVHVTFY